MLKRLAMTLSMALLFAVLSSVQPSLTKPTLVTTEVLVWKSPNELAQHLKAIGVDPQKHIVTYCNSGREASQLWFTLRHILGIQNVALYDGSWIDWFARRLPKE